MKNTCSSCGFESAIPARLCLKCGAVMPQADASEETSTTPAAAPQPAGSYNWVITVGCAPYIALALLRAGAAVDASNNAGETPLHKAAWQGETATALALVEAGGGPGYGWPHTTGARSSRPPPRHSSSSAAGQLRGGARC